MISLTSRPVLIQQLFLLSSTLTVNFTLKGIMVMYLNQAVHFTPSHHRSLLYTEPMRASMSMEAQMQILSWLVNLALVQEDRIAPFGSTLFRCG